MSLSTLEIDPELQHPIEIDPLEPQHFELCTFMLGVGSYTGPYGRISVMWMSNDTCCFSSDWFYTDENKIGKDDSSCLAVVPREYRWEYLLNAVSGMWTSSILNDPFQCEILPGHTLSGKFVDGANPLQYGCADQIVDITLLEYRGYPRMFWSNRCSLLDCDAANRWVQERKAVSSADLTVRFPRDYGFKIVFIRGMHKYMPIYTERLAPVFLFFYSGSFMGFKVQPCKTEPEDEPCSHEFVACFIVVLATPFIWWTLLHVCMIGFLML